MGLVDVLDGRAEQGIGRVRDAVAESRAGEPAAPGMNGLLMRILLEACASAEAARAGLAADDEALEMGGGAQLWEPEVRRLRAGFLGALGAASEEVERELARAVDIAERRGARLFELRAREDLELLRAGTL